VPVKRTRSKVRDHRITPEAIQAYLADDYGALHRALGLKPWETSPLWVEPGPAPSNGTSYALTYAKAQELREELEAAVRKSDD
jgi:hypothetical protein